MKKGNDYLNPDIDIIADESLSEESKSKLSKFLSKWLTNYINEVLGDLVKLTKYKITNQYLRGLVFQLYENNGVIKRSEIDKIVKSIPSEERKKLWGMGVKIGRYHIYLPKMLKPKAVEFRIGLWKIFHNLSGANKIPASSCTGGCKVSKRPPNVLEAPQVYRLLLRKFDRTGRQAVCFDDFIQCCLVMQVIGYLLGQRPAYCDKASVFKSLVDLKVRPLSLVPIRYLPIRLIAFPCGLRGSH